MKGNFKMFMVTLATIIFGFLVGCGKKDGGDATDLQSQAKKLIKTPNIRVVIGSTSTGGDTYQIASIMSKKLGEVMGKNVKVDAVGFTNSLDTIGKSKDGSSVMLFHDQTYLGYLYEQPGYKDIFAEFKIGPTLAINPGNGFSVAKKSKFNTAQDVIDAAGNGEKVRVSIQPGGASEIAFSALKNAVRIQYPGKEENIVAVNTGSQADKNQQLFDGLADVIHVSIQSNEQFNHLPETDQKAMKFIWLTSSKAALDSLPDKGFGATPKADLMKYAEPNSTVTLDGTNNFVFDKDFFLMFNKEMAPELVKLYDDAVAEAFKDQAFIDELETAFFSANPKSSDESFKYLKQKSDDYGKVINAIK